MSKDNTKRDLVPRLRFPEFQDTDGWQTPELAEIYGFKRTNTLSRDQLNYEAGTMKNIHYGDIHTKFQARFRVSDEYVPYVNAEVPDSSFNGDSFCEEGDIVLADASEDLNDVGKAIEIVSLDGYQVVAGTHTILASRRRDKPIVGFGGYLFQSATVRAGIQREAQGAKVFGISGKRISSVLIPMPRTGAEQRKIADCLGSLDDLIAAEGQKLQSLRNHKKGLMQQLFPREGETQPRLRFPEFRSEGDWSLRALSDLLFEIRERNRELKYGAMDVLSVSGEFGCVNQIAFLGRSYAGASVREYRVVETGDIVYTKSPLKAAPYGIVKENKGKPGIVSTLYAVYRATSACLPAYLDHYFSRDYHLNSYLQPLVNKGAKNDMKVNNTDVLRGEIRVPELPEQQCIAGCLSALAKQIALQAEKLDALCTHKRGLMQQLFPAPEGHK